MKKLNFENTNEFERVFKKQDKEVTDAIVEGIVKAYEDRKKTASLFDIGFFDTDLRYEISLPCSQWEIALESCMDHYREIDETNAAIDVYLLQKEVRKWLS